MKIKEIKKTIERKSLVSPSHIEEIDTGEFEIKKMRNINGEIVEKTVPIIKKINVEAVYKNISEEVVFHTVEKDGEIHEFSKKEDAQRFVGGK